MAVFHYYSLVYLLLLKHILLVYHLHLRTAGRKTINALKLAIGCHKLLSHDILIIHIIKLYRRSLVLLTSHILLIAHKLILLLLITLILLHLRLLVKLVIIRLLQLHLIHLLLLLHL